MRLDEFDVAFLSASGDPVSILKNFLGINIAFNNAKKYRSGINAYLKYKQEHTEVDLTSQAEEASLNGDGSQSIKRTILLSEADKLNPVKLMQMMGYDPLQWELVNAVTRRASWDVTMKLRADYTKKLYDSEGNWKEANVIAHEDSKQTNYGYNVKITVKPIQKQITQDIVRSVFEGLQPPALQVYRYQPKADASMLVLPILDFHLGKLAWGEETGEDYDMKIAEKIYKQVVLDIIQQLNMCNIIIDKIIFPIGQDYYHMDTVNNTTTGGTQMDSDTRWAKMYLKGVELLVWAIEQLRPIAPVECMYVAGNHDKMLSYCATAHIDAYYRNIDTVTVDVSPTVRKYVQYGNVLLGMSHGKEEGRRINGLMQIEEPEAWGETIFREWYLGDLHHEESKEDNGIIIRRLSAITATDAWHNDKGFKGAIKKAQAFVWDKKRGNRHVINSVVFGSDFS